MSLSYLNPIRMTPQAKMWVFVGVGDSLPSGNSLSSENRLTAEISYLPSASRAILADKLIESLEFDIDTDIQSAWSSEAKKRRDEVRDGSVRVIPGDRV